MYPIVYLLFILSCCVSCLLSLILYTYLFTYVHTYFQFIYLFSFSYNYSCFPSLLYSVPYFLFPICHAADSGDSETHTTKVPLLLIPGSAQTIHSWGPHVKALSKWRRIIIPEFRCQGLATTLRPEFSSVTQLVADLSALIAHIGLSECDLCGFSLGGRVALAYGAAQGSKARKVSVTGVPLVRPPLGRTIMQSWAEGLEHEEMHSSCWSFVINGYSTGFLQQNRAHLAKFVDAVVKANDAVRLKHLFRFSMSEQPDDYNSITSCVARLTMPIQIIGGSEDRLCAIESIIALHEVRSPTIIILYYYYFDGWFSYRV
jgi:pimeloyl-ACP methyl ester carboxylesterase